MKRFHYSTFFLTLALLCPASLALDQSPYIRDLERLTAERNKALAAATEPIQRRYHTALQDLLKRATQKSDAEAVLKIRNALHGGLALPTAHGQSDGAASPEPGSTPASVADLDASKIKSKRALQKALVGTTWTLTSAPNTAGHELVIFTSEDFVQVAGNASKSKWEPVDRRTISIDGFPFVFDENLQSFQAVDWHKSGPRFGKRRNP